MAKKRLLSKAFGGWATALLGRRSGSRAGVNRLHRKARRRRRTYR